jgi:hypothetical protein
MRNQYQVVVLWAEQIANSQGDSKPTRICQGRVLICRFGERHPPQFETIGTKQHGEEGPDRGLPLMKALKVSTVSMILPQNDAYRTQN